eukprot:2134928-Pyramimonas_sp.AAC.1
MSHPWLDAVAGLQLAHVLWLREAWQKLIELQRQRPAVLVIVVVGVRIEHLLLPIGISVHLQLVPDEPTH